jgi:hypothetical protein
VAGEALFIGWGQVVRGREQRALEVFNESVQYWGSLQEDGTIDSLDVVLLSPHGGDLAGFALLKGDGEKLALLRRDDEFIRRNARANLIVEGLGIVDAVSGERLGEQMGIFTKEAEEVSQT